MSVTTEPAIDGWFTAEPEPALLGTRCAECGTVFFPPVEGLCRNPGCFARDLQPHRLSNRGRIWSYTDARYQPPAPYVSPHADYRPFCLAAVELEAEAMIVLGQVVDGIGVDDLAVGQPVRLVIDTLFTETTEAGEVRRTVWKWEPTR